MNPGAIWWGQIGSSLGLLAGVSNALRDCRSVVLRLPRALPWRQEFYDGVELRRSAFGGERRLKRLEWIEGTEPGEFVLDELCSGKVRANYWPGMSYAAYLGGLEDILLNDYYVWITGIHTRQDMAAWAEFVAEYSRAARGLEQSAVFVLEYDGGNMESAGVERMVYTVEDYDCRVFSLEASAALGNCALRNYQAELALSISGCDPEWCFALLGTGELLLNDPVAAVKETAERCCTSRGEPFPLPTEQQINSAAWEAAIRLLFPLIERYRLGFISRHEPVIARHLPISNSNGDRVTDPYELEIGPLAYVVSSSKDFPPAEAEKIRLCHKARNLLAHNKFVARDVVEKVLAL